MLLKLAFHQATPYVIQWTSSNFFQNFSIILPVFSGFSQNVLNHKIDNKLAVEISEHVFDGHITDCGPENWSRFAQTFLKVINRFEMPEKR